MPIAPRLVRPKILVVTSHWPLAQAYGAQQRVLNIGRLLERIGDTSWVIVPSEAEDEETARRTKAAFNLRAVIRPIQSQRVAPIRRVSERIRHECDPSYLASDPYVVSESDRAKIGGMVAEHDVVWVHTVRTAHWFRFRRWPHSVLDVDDLPSRAYRSSASSGENPVRRLLDLRMAWIWRRRELTLHGMFDVLTVCSEDDRRYLKQRESIHVIPNGANPAPCGRRIQLDSPRIGFIGNCAFGPNLDGVMWFIQRVWPKIKEKLPQAQFRLLGRGSDGAFAREGPDITSLGWIEDPGDEIGSWSVMVVPIRVGSGTRVKMADGFARKCPIVATSVGAFGYDVASGKEAILADGVEDFVSACLMLLKNPKLGEAMAEKAHERFMHDWTWDSFEGTVGNAIDECIRKSRMSPHSHKPSLP